MAPGKTLCDGLLYVQFFLFEGLVFSSFHALPFNLFFSLPLKYFLQGIVDFLAYFPEIKVGLSNH
jgi:hypothetical protein